jgi:hypothetical protein
MQPGFMLDRGTYDECNVAQWIEGEPEKSFWFGLKTKGRQALPITALRCPTCGRLDLFAFDPPKA